MHYEPLYCRQDAFTALRDQLPDLETTDGLVRAAIAVSQHELNEGELASVESALDDLADQILGRVVRNDPRALLAHAHHVLFEEARFRGNIGDYDNPANSYLPTVLKARLGLPITLCLIYKAVLERLGLRVVGINAPGHFLAGVTGEAVGNVASPDAIAFIDPFAKGRLLSRSEALDYIVKAVGGDLLLDENLDMLPIASHKHWLMRIITNLAMSFERRSQPDDRDAMTEMLRLVESQC